jgi:hypothetical protein
MRRSATLLLPAIEALALNVRGKGGATRMSVAVTTFGSAPVLKPLVAKGAKAENRLMVGAAQGGDLEAIRYLPSVGVSPCEADSATIFAGGLAIRHPGRWEAGPI